MDWSAIIAAAVGLGATLLSRWLDKRAATEAQIERWGRLAFWLTVGVLESNVAPARLEAQIIKWRARVARFAEAAGVEIRPKQWERLEQILDTMRELKARESIENSLALILESADEMEAALDKHAERVRKER